MTHLLLLCLSFSLLCHCHNDAEKATTWTVSKVGTNYVEKGQADKFDLPKTLKGLSVVCSDSLLILEGHSIDLWRETTLIEEYGDTIWLEKVVTIKVVDDDSFTLQYPGDELSSCSYPDIDTCIIGKNFAREIGVPGNSIQVRVASEGKSTKGRAFVFCISPQRRVIYWPRDFLLLYIEPLLAKR